MTAKKKEKTETFRSAGETDTTYTRYGIIERLRLEWAYIHHEHLIEPQESDLGDYPDTIHNQFDNMTGSMNL